MARKKATAIEADPVVNPVVKPPLFRNSWAVLPMRVFLGCLFMFAGYAKLTYPGFFDANSDTGFRATLVGVKQSSPIGGALQPMIDHSSLFGHVTAVAEIAIGLGLVVGLLTRIAALGGIALTTLIALSVNWTSIKQYTGSYGWYTSVDIAIAVALTVFVIGGSGPLSGDRLFGRMRARKHAVEPSDGYHQAPSSDESMARLRGADGDYGQSPYVQSPHQDQMPYQDQPSYQDQPWYQDQPPSRAEAPAPTPDDYPTEVHSTTGHPTVQLPTTEHAVESGRSAPETQQFPVVEQARIDDPDFIDDHDDLPPSPRPV